MKTYRVTNPFDRIHASKQDEVGTFIKVVDGYIGLRFDDDKEFYFCPEEITEIKQ